MGKFTATHGGGRGEEAGSRAATMAIITCTSYIQVMDILSRHWSRFVFPFTSRHDVSCPPQAVRAPF